MNRRLLQFVKYACGRQSVFAERMGWERQYLSKLTRGIGLGITPVVSILKEFPELDARWLLLGEGEMLRSIISESRPQLAAARSRVARSLELSRYLPVMSENELAEFAAGRLDFPASSEARWDSLLPSAAVAEKPKTCGVRAD